MSEQDEIIVDIDQPEPEVVDELDNDDFDNDELDVEESNELDNEPEVVDELESDEIEVDVTPSEEVINATIQQKDSRIQELEEQLSQYKPKEPEPKQYVRLDKPNLSDPDIDYDEELYAEKYFAWKVQSLQEEYEHNQQVAKEEAIVKSYQEQEDQARNRYKENSKNIDKTILTNAENYVNEKFNEEQLYILLHKCKNTPLVVAALKANQKESEKLLNITDRIDFAVSILEFEKKLRVNQRPSKAPEGDTRLSSNTRTGVTKSLEQLEKEADRTGDRTAVINFKRQQR